MFFYVIQSVMDLKVPSRLSYSVVDTYTHSTHAPVFPIRQKAAAFFTRRVNVIIRNYIQLPQHQNKGKCVVIMNHYIYTDQYAIQHNNFGVNCYMASGDLDGALNYFRQALAAKLASEQRLLATTTKESSGETTLHNLDDANPMEVGTAVADADEQLQHERCVTPDPIDFCCSDRMEFYALSDVTGVSIKSLMICLTRVFP